MTFEDEYLAHHGIKGQRWGIRRTPEELGHRSPNKRREQRAKKAEERKQEKARRAAEKNLEDKENLKAYLRKHPKKLPKYSNELTKEEAAEIISNIEFDRKLKDIRQAETDRTWEKIRGFSNKMQTVGSLLNNSKTIYNSYVEINNALVDSGVYKDGKKKTKLGEKAEEDKTKYNALRTADPEDIMTALKGMSDRQVADYAARRRNLDAIERSLYPDDNSGKNKGGNTNTSDVMDKLDEILNKINR